MSTLDDSRILRLERLEARTLFAGDLVTFESGLDSVDRTQSSDDQSAIESNSSRQTSDNNDASSRSAEGRRATNDQAATPNDRGNDRSTNDQVRSFDGQQSRPSQERSAGERDARGIQERDNRNPTHRSGDRRSGSNDRGTAESISDNLTVSGNSTSSSSATSTSGNSLQNNSSNSASQTTPTNDNRVTFTVATGGNSGGGTVFNSPAASEPIAQQTSLVDERVLAATDAAISSLTNDESNTGTNTVSSQDSENTIDDEANANALAIDGGDQYASEYSFDENDDVDSQDESGWQPWVPLWSFGQSDSSDPVDLSPWQLRSATLPMLRRIVEASPSERAEIADDLMKNWFSGPGGLISLDRVLLPTPSVSVENLSIDVQLESAVMLHRSLAMVATGSVPALSGPVLDAIMASIDAAAESPQQPIADAVPTRIRVSGYSAIAAAVSIATAVAARQRFKHRTQSEAHAIQS
ncbi:MAG: hypothetical protein ACF8CQ_08330 [Rhodopirellula sp. JB044]|uniref:hypothetical protein n=1 Tax=Rhodopirellula sp. JB044 TaxID=3342844 RepID=UPI00370A2091